jgi:hypothetical protein
MPLWSKQRPRFTRAGHAYKNPAYDQALKDMRSSLSELWPYPPIDYPISVHLHLCGEGRGDLDNIAGFILDAAGPVRATKKKEALPGVLWVDDRVSIISHLSISWTKGEKADSCWDLRIVKLRP